MVNIGYKKYVLLLPVYIVMLVTRIVAFKQSNNLLNAKDIYTVFTIINAFVLVKVIILTILIIIVVKMAIAVQCCPYTCRKTRSLCGTVMFQDCSR